MAASILSNFIPEGSFAYEYIEYGIARQRTGVSNEDTLYELVVFAETDIGTIYKDKFYSQDQYTNNRRAKKTLYPY